MCVIFVCRQSESYQEDIYPMTAGNRCALTAEEWLSGIDKGALFLFKLLSHFLHSGHTDIDHVYCVKIRALCLESSPS